jgi:hypothetical protein
MTETMLITASTGARIRTGISDVMTPNPAETSTEYTGKSQIKKNDTAAPVK